MISTAQNRTVRTPSSRGLGARVLTALAFVGVFAAACDVHGVSGPGTLTSIVVTPNATLPTNGTQQMVAVGYDASGRVVGIAPTWSIAAGGGAVNATGAFTAGAVAGLYANTVVATVGGVSGRASITVIPGALATMIVTPTPVTLAVGATQQFVVVGRDAANNIVPVTPTWSVVAGGGAVDAAGLFTAGGTVGTYSNTVRAASGAVAATATVTVTSGGLATITVTPNPALLAIGATQQFVAVGKDGSGNVVALSPVWSVVAGGGAVDAVGLFTAGAVAGTYLNTVKATSGAISGTATVTVSAAAPPPPIVSLGSAAADGIIAGAAVTCITGGLISADVAISPGNTINGFGPCVVTGVQHLADAVAAQAQIDLTAAYNALAGLPCPPANAIVANLGGTTKAAGVYCTASGIGVTGVLTLDGGGNPNASFVFQAGTGLTTAGDIVLINGAQAKNVFWQVGTSATIGTASKWQGNIVALTSITLVDNATLLGRALARNGSVSLGNNNVITLP